MVTAEQARASLAAHGRLKSQPIEDWSGDFELPPSVADFYHEVGPVNVAIETGGNPIVLPRLSKLWKLQDGYRFVGRKRQREQSWDEDWLVIADQGADPFIFSRETGGVSLAEHGEGTWEPVPLFPNLNAMAACLGLIGSWVDSGEVGSVLAKLTTLLGEPAESGRILSALGFAVE